MSALYAEVETYFGEPYFQCEEHYLASLTMTSGHIKKIPIPPRNATDSSTCDNCVMRALRLAGAETVDVGPVDPKP